MHGPIRPGDVPHVFDDVCICTLVDLARLPTGIDLGRFGDAVRAAVRIYLDRAAEPAANELHREIAALHRAAERGEYETLAELIERMSPAARRMIASRQAIIEDRRAFFAARPGRFAKRADYVPDWRILDPAELRDPATRKPAADGLLGLITQGMRFRERNRPSGRPTKNLVPVLIAPPPSRAEARRAAERDMVMWLQVAIAEQGQPVTLTARRPDAARGAGPMVNMIARVLVLAGACGTAGAETRAVRLLNDLQQQRKQRRRRRSLLYPQRCHDE